MVNDKITVRHDSGVADKMIAPLTEQNAKQDATLAASLAARPWTEDYLLPSISFREPKHS
jgi:hypothetical protein